MELWGNLKDFSLPDVIQLVGFGRKTGVLSVEHNMGGSMLFFEKGNVVHAKTGPTEGEEAVFELFKVGVGEFRFQSEVSPPKQTIDMDPTNLVMEAARLFDEAGRHGEVQAPELVMDSGPDEDSLPSGEMLFDEIDKFETAPSDNGRMSPEDVRNNIKYLLDQSFGRDAKRLTQAVDKCGDTFEEFEQLTMRVERFISAFMGNNPAQRVGAELREIIKQLRSPN